MYTASELNLFMEEALKEAKIGLQMGEVPVGCVLVYRQGIVARRHNRCNFLCNAARHCELEVIDDFFETQQDSLCPLESTHHETTSVPQNYVPPFVNSKKIQMLQDCDLFVTCEPCIMCAVALRFLRIRHVYFGCNNEHFGGCGSVISVSNQLLKELPILPITSGILAHKAVEYLQLFYAIGNPNGTQSELYMKTFRYALNVVF
ncbi:uncharacterized protein LOC128883394 isoform X2 [Hylaeus volcanicus]|uniref:uncharacterized protein LOC128883394 isoform X2 n=1 Tax=Hylaeus volcanicus TaxID=313075 RepID=UPI0023B8103D|nr:uncharacterized protein LOC128883394 isoform X2 [Hylaeus volcanicus]